MPYYSAIFRGHIKPNAVVVGAASMFIQHSSLHLFRSPNLLFSRPSSLVRSLHSQRSRVLSAKAGRSSLEWRVSNLPYFQKQGYGRIAYNDYESSDESDRDVVGSSQSQQMAGSTLDNIDQWRFKLTMLLRNGEDQEVVSRERKDRRDFDHISAMATRMGLYSRQYSKIIVISKSPLPNYRPDLDDKRPQREVVLPFGLQSEVDAHLHAFLDQKKMLIPEMSRPSSSDSLATGYGNYEKPETVMQNSLARERILRPRSLQLRSKQQQWVDSPEGQKMVEFRKTLPAYKEKEALLRAISANQVIVVSGETGCGKTTQLPQYILESEIEAACGAACSIICTQPRRISAISVSERVAAERGEQIGESVGYKVRLEGMRGRDTRLLFCTTGVLLRRLLIDRSLKGVTHVVVDEIHERGMNEDFLLIVLKDLLPRRPDLKLILMSATLNAELFSSYFGGAPAMHIPGFTYPVRAHFLEDFLETTGYRLTSYNQIDDYGEEKTWKMQKQAQFTKRKSQISSAVEGALEAADFKGYQFRTRDSLSCWSPDSMGFNLIENVLCHIVKGERPGAVLVFMTGWDDINSLKKQLEAHHLLGDPNKVLLLACHGSMASSEQRLIFDRPPEGVRKVVLATNMAETSITINDVVFVVDCGKAKETSYDALNNTPCLLPSWISKAAARQRRGRAGRVMPGECYHLYPRCVYDAFADYQQPELLRTPLQSLCLQIKSLGLGSISEFLSRALQPPEALSVQNAVEYLKLIGALDDNENLTALGKNLSMLPVEPKLGKMLILGAIFNCLDPIMTVVAGLSVRDPFLMPFDKKDLAESARSKFSGRDCSDHLTLIRAYSGWKDAERTRSGNEYCWQNFLSAQTLKAMDSMRKQFFFLLKEASLIDNVESCSKLSYDEHLVRAIICAGLFPGVCSVVNKEKSITQLGYSQVWGLFSRFFSPLGMAPVVGLVGLGMFQRGFPQLGNCIEIGLPMLLLVIGLTQYLKHVRPFKDVPIFERFPILICVTFVWIYAIILTASGAYRHKPSLTQHSCRTDKANLISTAPWFKFPYPLQWGPPTFAVGHSFAMMSAVLVSMVESTGAYMAASRLAIATPPPAYVLSRGIGWQGIGVLLDGLFGTGTGSTVLVENVGLLGLTRVGSRRVVQVSAGFMIFFSILGKFGAVFASIPVPIYAALHCVLFGLVAAVGLSLLQFTNMNSMRNLTITGLSLFLGISIPQFFVHYWDARHYGLVHTDAGWFNAFLNTVFMSPPTVGLIIAVFMDNTVDVEMSKKDRGMPWWVKFRNFRGDNRNEEFYNLPFNLNRFFPPT